MTDPSDICATHAAGNHVTTNDTNVATNDHAF
jgi:hypothetical protein